jgi:signal peptidase II
MLNRNLPQAKWNIIFFAIALVVVTIDQLSKWWIQGHFYPGQSVPETGPFRLTYAQNTGAAFSIFNSRTDILAVVSMVGVIIIIVYNFILYRHFPTLDTHLNKISLGLILGGTIGNLIDRVWLHYVRDFIDAGPWPIFNAADSSLVVGIIIFAASILFFSRNIDSEPNKR